jgi:hypothetical protein
MLLHCLWFYFCPRPHMWQFGWQAYLNFLPHIVINENSAVIWFFQISGYVLGLQLSTMEGYGTSCS